jgi:hypothetical protein
MENTQPIPARLLFTALTAQYSTLAIALRVALEDYWECCDEVDEEGFALDSVEEVCARRLGLVILAAVVCEGVINAYLSLTLPAADFVQVEQGSLQTKWTTAIRDLLPDYSVPEDLQKDLQDLVTRRNSIVHSKPTVHSGKTTIHEGTVKQWENIDDALIERIYHLTPRLLVNLEKFDEAHHKETPFRVLMLITGLQTALNIPSRDACRNLRRLRRE